MVKKKNIVFRVAPVILFISISFFVVYYSPSKIVESVGVSNSYFLLAIFSFIGGLTIFSGVPYHLLLIALVAAGLNPIALGLLAASGVMLGDCTSYLIGYNARVIIPEGWQRVIGRLSSFFLRYPRFLPAFFFLYGSLIPFSNDLIVVSMGFVRYPFWRVMLPLALGNLVFNVSLALLVAYAYGSV